MEQNEIKRDNRKALPKYLLILLVSGVIGGVLGFASGWMGHDSLSETVIAAVNAGLTAIAPWTIPVTSVVSLAVILGLYRSARGLFESWDGEDEDVMDQADEKLNWALLVTSAQLILDMFFFAMVVLYGTGWAALIGVGAFLVFVFLLVFAQQKVVDLTRRMNPEKRGSVYDVNFKKKWFESCDEAERNQIGRAAYKAFNVVNVASPLMWVVFVLLSFAFNVNTLLPALAVCLLWGLLNVSYCLECIRLGRRKHPGGDAV